MVSEKYLTDSGAAFTSGYFTKDLMDLKQEIHFVGVGTDHQNFPAECHISIIMKMTRTMMIHAAIHWPALTVPVLYHMAVNHACSLFNHIPKKLQDTLHMTNSQGQE